MTWQILLSLLIVATLGGLVWAILSLVNRGEPVRDRKDLSVGLRFIPGDTVLLIEPGVPRKRWRAEKVQHVHFLRESGGRGNLGYMVGGVYRRAESLEAVRQ